MSYDHPSMLSRQILTISGNKQLFSVLRTYKSRRQNYAEYVNGG